MIETIVAYLQHSITMILSPNDELYFEQFCNYAFKSISEFHTLAICSNPPTLFDVAQ